jgi:predicted nucleic acid-binding protein
VLLDAFDAAVHSWSQESFRLSLVSVTSDIVAEAARMVARHDLGSLDAVHLATASVVRRTIDPEVVVAVFDRRLRVALTAEGFALVPALLDT